MSQHTLAAFLLPEGFAPPHPAAVLHEASIVGELGRCATRALTERLPLPCVRGRDDEPRRGDPVLLVPGFLAGDVSLLPLARGLRRSGHRAYRSHITANVGCTRDAAEELEVRLEHVVEREGRRARLVGHSLGGMLARGVAARRPDLVSGLVTLGSPVLAPAAHHVSLTAGVQLLLGLSRIGVRGLMAADCVAGECARQSFDDCRAPLDPSIAYTAVWSRRDGFVDWRACVEPGADAVEVRTSHAGMAVCPTVLREVRRALRHQQVAVRAA